MKIEELKKYSNVAICGYRNKGRALLEKLQNAGIHIPYIIERNYEALGRLEEELEVSIVGFDKAHEFYSQADVILWSGDLPEALVKECMEIAGIDIPMVSVEWE